MSEMIRRGAEAALADLGYVNALNPDDPHRRTITIQLSSADVMGMVQAVIEAMREPVFIEQACRAAADPRTGYICWEGISVHRAADVVDAVLGAALGREP